MKKNIYHPPATPYQRLLADARTSDEVRRRVTALHATPNPVALLRSIRAAPQELMDIADRPLTAEATPPTAPTIEQLLVGLRIAWQDGEVRPIGKAKEQTPRGRRRPVAFVAVTTQMRAWFAAEPWRRSRELFERLQTEQRGVFPDGQLRTLPRRLKEWRREKAHGMAFGRRAAPRISEPAQVSSQA